MNSIYGKTHISLLFLLIDYISARSPPHMLSIKDNDTLVVVGCLVLSANY